MKITIPKGSHFIPMDLVSEFKMNYPLTPDDNDGNNMQKTDECELLLPMSVMSINKKNDIGTTIASVSTIKQLNGLEILRSRIVELKDKIVQYCGIEQYESIVNDLDNQLSEREDKKEESSHDSNTIKDTIKGITSVETARNVKAVYSELRSDYLEIENPTQAKSVELE